MKNSLWNSRLWVRAAILVLFFPLISGGQSPSGEAKKAAPAQRGASKSTKIENAPSPNGGNPYFSGVWRNERDGSCNMEDVNDDSCGVGAEASGRQRRAAQSRIIDPPDGKIPYLPWARQQQAAVAQNFQNPSVDQIDLQSRCLPGGVPRPFMHSPFQFVQVPGYVVLLHENFHLYRVIPLDGRPHIAKNVPLWMGDSRGHWEGNTLIVDVTNLNGRMWFDVVGNFHSEALHLVERFTVVDPNKIHYEARFDDPKVYSRPWTLAVDLKREEPGTELMEWACYEGEHDKERILR